MRYLLHDVFLKSVRAYPRRAAIRMEGGDILTYADLNAWANQFAHAIKTTKRDVRRQPYVGILSPVHAESVAAVLGTLKAGCAYVPLDEHSPPRRLAEILRRARVDVVCVDAHFFEVFRPLFRRKSIRHVIVLNGNVPRAAGKPPLSCRVTGSARIRSAPTKEPPALPQVSDDLAYILHSSGSTGVPKGIMLSHRNARTFVDWMQKEFQLTKEDVVMSRAPFKFDLSVFDIFNTLNVGATLVCYDWNDRRESPRRHEDYVRLMKKSKATILYTTPSTFVSLMNKGGLARRPLALRTLLYAGEPFPVPQLRKLQSSVPDARIANIYGPTETNIITYWWVTRLTANTKSVPLGYAVDDTEIIVVSEDGKRLCETNELGELWCRGGTVTLGYLGMPEATQRQYVQSPFHAAPARFWRTGDYGFRDKKGILHYRGRKDHMVKVRGFRIELGEIEAALARHPRLDEFCVVAIPDAKYGNRLICYYTVLDKKALEAGNLEKFLNRHLPDYMLPYGYVRETELPKTSSGKIDRVLLAERSRL